VKRSFVEARPRCARSAPDVDERAIVVSIFRYHEISESGRGILNPLSVSKLDQLGAICRLQAGQRHLDLACGKGEMLCRYARDHRITGVGIDIHPPFLDDARARANELGVEAQVRFLEGDAADPADVGDGFDVVSCIGATWIGGGLSGTLELMRARARRGSWLLVDEVFWAEQPPAQVRAAQAMTAARLRLAAIVHHASGSADG
jgi:SAM-dependent methyltransferase